jgi:triacylglycerol lipase
MIDLYWDFARMEGTRAATLKRFSLPWSHDVENDIARIKAPTLIIWGEHDGLVPPVYAEDFKSGIEGSKVVILKGTAHMPMYEDPDGFVSAVVDHLKS